jgi:hypothetical protein
LSFSSSASFNNHDDKHAVAKKHEQTAPTVEEKAEEFQGVAEEPPEVIE